MSEHFSGGYLTPVLCLKPKNIHESVCAFNMFLLSFSDHHCIIFKNFLSIIAVKNIFYYSFIYLHQRCRSCAFPLV